MDVLTKVVVTYETLPGWCCSTEGARKFEELPPQAQVYIRFIEEFLQVPGKMVYIKSDQMYSLLATDFFFLLLVINYLIN